jgi:HK97 family phage portal protein
MRKSKHRNLTKGPVVTPGSLSGPVNANFGQPGRVGAPGSIPVATESRSQYANLRPIQPPNEINDVDINLNWFSPFQPITPFGPPYVDSPREFDYEVGYNLQYVPARIQLFGALQAMSTWGILRGLIERRKDRFLRQPWEIRLIGKEGVHDPRIDELNKFFRKPDGKNRFSKWARLLLEDLLVIDAPSIFLPQTRGGKPLRAEILQGDSIFPLIDDLGRRPDYPQPAFQQRVKGLPMVNLNEREMIYAPMRPRPQMPIYGYSPVEQVQQEILLGIRRTVYQNNFYTEGSMPETIIGVPEAWTPQQIANFQGFFDALLAGNQHDKSKVRFVPGGMKPYDIKNANGESLKCEIDEWVARICCFAFSESPEPFIRMMNRSTAETADEASEEVALQPLNQWFTEEVMNEIIQDRFGYDDMEFAIKSARQVDPKLQAETHVTKVNAGLMTRNEARKEDNLPPVEGGDELTVTTSKGVFRLEDSIATGEALADQAANPPEPAGKPQGKSNE